MMRRLRAAGLAALAMGVVVAAAPAQKAARGTLLPPFLYPAKPKAEAPPPGPAPAATPDRNALLERLEDAHQRRLRVCDELRRVALEQDDARLEAEADQLEQRANALYETRSSHLLRTGTVAEPKGATATDETRELLIEQARRRREGGR